MQEQRRRRRAPKRSKPAPDIIPGQKLSAQPSLVIALRATLRALPTLFHDALPYDKESREELLVVTWRTMSAVWLATRVGGEYAALGYLARTVAGAGPNIIDRTSLQFSDAVFSTLETAIHVDQAAIHAAEVVEASAAALDSALMEYPLGDAARKTASRDLELLDEGTQLADLLALPIWHVDPPRQAAGLWSDAREQLLARHENWEVWLDWYEQRLRGTLDPTQLDIVRAREATEDDWKKGPAVANAKIRRAIERLTVNPILNALSEAAQDENAPPITARGDQLQFAEATQTDDDLIARRPAMIADYKELRSQLRALKVQVDEWVGKDCHPDWLGLKADISRLSRRTPAAIGGAAEQISVVWAAGVAVAGYLDQDRELRQNPSSGNAPGLPLPIKNKLRTFVQTFGAWLLEFPTVRQREENAHAFTSAMERLQAADEVVSHVRSSQALRTADLELLEQLLRAARGTGPQATKARFWSLATVKKVVFSAAKIVATAATQHVLDDVFESSVLLSRLKSLMIEGEASIATFVDELPSTSREALLGLIEGLRNPPS